ncbi:hypothetical protein TKK_0004013 [Trichogramma kaykai]|uniref:28S ribosomal protein S14, mitochondrial n=1 Tax=Trichogramma kaykai TaxID=54128 RepID=A0ABD2XQA1_9HYME
MALSGAISMLTKLIPTYPTITPCGQGQQIRSMYTKWKTMRDMKRRKLAKEYAPERLRLLGIKRNDVLPREIRDLASKTFEEQIPRHSAIRQLTPRCVVTSRPHGVLHRWRVSRFIFRHLVDYNKMGGVQRAIW